MREYTYDHAKPIAVSAAGLTFGGLELGVGRPVVLLHGFPEHHGSWRHTLPALANAGHRAIALDLKGYARSDAPRPGTVLGDYRLSTLGREMGEVLRALAPTGDVDVVGHDWGGAVLSAMSVICPERFQRAVWVNGPGRILVPWRLKHIAQFNIPGWAERRFWRTPIEFISEIVERWSYRPEAFSDDEIRDYVRCFQRGPAFKCAMAYYRSLRRDLGFLAPSVVRGLPRPANALVIWGQHDPIFPPGMGRAHARDLGAKLVTVDDAGHFPQTESPDAVNSALVDFLG